MSEKELLKENACLSDSALHSEFRMQLNAIASTEEQQ